MILETPNKNIIGGISYTNDNLISFHTSIVGNKTIKIPDTIQVGDIGVLYDLRKSPPNGWTYLASEKGYLRNVVASYKVLDNLDKNQTVNGNILLIFRSLLGISSVNVPFANSSKTNKNPAPMTIPIQKTPCIAIGMIGCLIGGQKLEWSNFSPIHDGETTHKRLSVRYKIFNSDETDVVFDMPDIRFDNILLGVCIEL